MNVRNDSAASGEKSWLSAVGSANALAPVSTANELMTASLAMNPVINAVDARQSEKPSGANTGEINRPTAASMLFALSATTLKRQSNVCRNQMMSVAIEDDRERAREKVFRFVPQQPQHRFSAGNCGSWAAP